MTQISKGAVDFWRKFDGEAHARMKFKTEENGALVRVDGAIQEEGFIDHREAIKDNLTALGEEALMFLPGSITVKAFRQGYEHGGVIGGAIWAGGGVVADALMLVAGPFMMAKDVGDIAAHAVALGVNRR